MSSSFASLNISPLLLKALKETGYQELTPVQERVIPRALKGESLIIKAPTGSGKTHAFMVPLLDHINVEFLATQALILVPTSVLGTQTVNFLKDLIKHFSKVTVGTLFTNRDLEKFQNSQIIVATPATFDKAMELNLLSTRNIETLVFDEADTLFMHDFIASKSNLVPLMKKTQVLFFTATIDKNLQSIIKKFLGAASVIDISPKELVASKVKHYLVDIKHVSPYVALKTFLDLTKPYKCMIFASKKETLIELSEQFYQDSIPMAIIHGDLDKRERAHIIRDFAADKFHLLLCSDLLARGFDAEDVTDVISLDLPKDLTYYFHRAGRTGRNSKEGNSYVFYNADNVSGIKELVNAKVPFEYYSLKGGELKADSTYNVEQLSQKKSNVFLDKEIQKAVAKVKTNRVKPCYKKKVRMAISKAKFEHKKKIIKTNIRKKSIKEDTTHGE